MSAAAAGVAWKSVKLAEICNVVRGASPRPKGDPRYFGGSIPWISIADITAEPGKYLSRTKEGVTEAGAAKSRLLKAGTLVVSNSATICVPKILRVDGCIHDGFVALLDVHPTVDIHYHLPHFNFVRDFIRAKNTQGVTQVNLNTEIFKGFDVPLPPLPQQRRIAVALDQIDALRAKGRHAIAKLTQLPLAYFDQMFRNKFPRMRIVEITSRVTNGYVGPVRGIYRKHGVPYLLAKHVKGNRIRFDKQTYITEEFNAKHSKSILKAGDVLLVQSGHVGESAVVPSSHEGHNCHAMIVITPKREYLIGEYLSFLFSTPEMTQRFRGITTGITLDHLNCRDVREINVQIPPLDLQKKFAQLLAAIEGLRAKHLRALERVDALFMSVQRRAFRGEL